MCIHFLDESKPNKLEYRRTLTNEFGNIFRVFLPDQATHTLAGGSHAGRQEVQPAILPQFEGLLFSVSFSPVTVGVGGARKTHSPYRAHSTLPALCTFVRMHEFQSVCSIMFIAEFPAGK